MKKIAFLCLFFLAACGSQSGVVPTATDEQIGVLVPRSAMMTNTISTPKVDEVGTAIMVLAKDAATSTSAAAATGTSAVVTTTSEAKETQAFWVGVTFAIGTQRATQTQIAGTSTGLSGISGTQTSVPLTQTMIAATQVIQQDELRSKRISVWAMNIGSGILVLALSVFFAFALYKGLRFAEEAGKAKNLKAKADALKPDGQGRFGLLTESDLGKSGKLINANLMHRSVLDPNKADDLTSQQALDNTSGHRRLEAVRSISTVPMLRSAAKTLMAPEQPKMPAGDVQITKPDQPLLSSAYPALPDPSWKMLTKWDGEQTPIGVDENENLIRVDPAQRPHLMVVGMSGSGKTLTFIRTEVAALLTQGWNVICMGKQVDFMPFVEHPNFSLIAVDVKNDANKYVEILNTLTAQMDIRDKLLSSKNISTWDRYGAPSTKVILDDYSGAMTRMSMTTEGKKMANAVMAEAKYIAMDGRKFGIHLTIGLQRATWRMIDPDLRAMMGRIVYKVESELDSRIALGTNGAEQLPIFRNFLTRMTDDSSLQRGVGFFLDDMQVDAFLRSRPVKENEKLDWIDGQFKDIPEEVDTEITQRTNSVPSMSVAMKKARKKAEDTVKVQEIYVGYLNNKIKPVLRDIEKAVYGYKGGNANSNVVSIIAAWEGVDESELNDVIDRHVAEWNAEKPATTTGENGHIQANLSQNPA